jgi:hypothetical protein
LRKKIHANASPLGRSWFADQRFASTPANQMRAERRASGLRQLEKTTTAQRPYEEPSLALRGSVDDLLRCLHHAERDGYEQTRLRGVTRAGAWRGAGKLFCTFPSWDGRRTRSFCWLSVATSDWTGWHLRYVATQARRVRPPIARRRVAGPVWKRRILARFCLR